jgi:hypothetical protein
MKRSAHKDIVDETTAHLDSGNLVSTFKLDTTLGTLRDRSVAWILNAYHDINKKELILKVCVLTSCCKYDFIECLVQAFELFRVGKFNLSHASLTSPDALSALRQLPVTNPALYHEITAGKANESTGDDEPTFSPEAEDGSDIPIDVVRSVVIAGRCVVDRYKIDEEGSIIRTGVAEDSEAEIDEANSEAGVIMLAANLGCGHRSKVGSKRYGADWEEH